MQSQAPSPASQLHLCWQSPRQTLLRNSCSWLAVSSSPLYEAKHAGALLLHVMGDGTIFTATCEPGTAQQPRDNRKSTHMPQYSVCQHRMPCHLVCSL